MFEIIDVKSISSEKVKLYQTDRFIRGPATIQITDSQGEVVKVADLEESMTEFKRRGGIVMVEHTHWHVGTLVSWEVKSYFDEDTKTEVPSLYVETAFFKGKKRDEVAWQLIKEKKIVGFSIAYSDHSKHRKCDTVSCKTIVTNADMMELTVTGDPANKPSLFDEIEGKNMTDSKDDKKDKDKDEVKPPAEPDDSDKDKDKDKDDKDKADKKAAADSKKSKDSPCNDKSDLEIDQKFITDTHLAVKSLSSILDEFSKSFKEIKEFMVTTKAEKDLGETKIKELELEISKKSAELAKLKEIDSPGRPKIVVKSGGNKTPRGQQKPRTWQEIEAESHGSRGIKIRTN